jgi:putative ABC transport system permease protein
MFARMVVKALTRGPARRALIALTTALGACVATAMLGVVWDVGDKVNAELKAYGANIAVQPKGAAVLGGRYEANAELAQGATLREDELTKIKTIFWAFNIVDFAPFLDAEVTLAGAASGEATLVGTWFAKPLSLPTGEHATAGILGLRSWWQVEGGWIADGDEDLALVGAALAERSGLELGDPLTVSGAGGARALRVAGIVTTGGDEDSQVIAPLATVQAVTGRPGEVERVEVSALTTPDNDLARRAARNPASLSVSERETWYCTAYASAIAYQIEEVMTDAVAKPVRQVTESEGSVLTKTRLLMLLVTALSLLASALAIANLITAAVMERAPEIGLLKAVGASDGAVVRLVLAEMAVVGAAGAAVGVGAGFGLAQVIGQVVFESAIALRPAVVAMVAALIALVVLAGSLPSIRTLARLRPADVLHGR